jgi:hypothetical protein
MPPMNLRWKVWGRPVKPVALALTITMLIIAWAAVTNVGVLNSSSWADLLAGSALLTAGVLVAGWVRSSQRLAEVGLLLASFVWATRFWLIVLVNPGNITLEGLWLSVCWVVVASGSYLLEKADQRASAGA